MLIESLEVGAIHYTNKDGIRKIPHEVMFSLYTGRAFSIDEKWAAFVYKDNGVPLEAPDHDWYGIGATYEDGWLKDLYVAEEWKK